MNDEYVSIPFQIDREFPFFNASIPVQNLIRATRAFDPKCKWTDSTD